MQFFFKFRRLKVMKSTLQVLFLITFCALAVQSFAQKSSSTGEDDNELNVFIPNAFTPNSDSFNDVFVPVISGPDLEFYEMVILDRSGKEVFRTTDQSKVWTGTVKGSDYISSPTIFVYFLKLKTVNSIDTKTYSGHIVMIR